MWADMVITWPSENKEWLFQNMHRWINPLCKSTLPPKLMQQNKLILMVIFPVLGCFPVYHLTVSQARKTNQKSLLIKMLETFVNKGTDGCELTWSLLDTYIWHILRNNSRNVRKQMNEWVWADMVITLHLHLAYLEKQFHRKTKNKMQQNKKIWSYNDTTIPLLLRFLHWLFNFGSGLFFL